MLIPAIRDNASSSMTEAAAQIQKLLRQQAAIARFGSFALRERDLDKILAEAVRVCAEGLGAPFCKVCRYRAETNDLLIVAGYGWQDRRGWQRGVARRHELAAGARLHHRPAVDHRPLQQVGDFNLPPFYAAHGIVSIIDVIIKGVDDQPYGILEIDNDRQHDYDEHDINFLTAFANVLAEVVVTAPEASPCRSPSTR